MTESVVLSLIGGGLGLALGLLGIRALLAVNTAGLPRVGVDGALVGLDWRVLSYTLVVALGTGILFGLFPAFQSTRTDLTTTLKESSGRSGTGFRQNKARSILVVTEVALASTTPGRRRNRSTPSRITCSTASDFSYFDPPNDICIVSTLRGSKPGST